MRLNARMVLERPTRGGIVDVRALYVRSRGILREDRSAIPGSRQVPVGLSYRYKSEIEIVAKCSRADRAPKVITIGYRKSDDGPRTSDFRRTTSRGPRSPA